MFPSSSESLNVPCPPNKLPVNSRETTCETQRADKTLSGRLGASYLRAGITDLTCAAAPASPASSNTQSRHEAKETKGSGGIRHDTSSKEADARGEWPRRTPTQVEKRSHGCVRECEMQNGRRKENANTGLSRQKAYLYVVFTFLRVSALSSLRAPHLK